MLENPPEKKADRRLPPACIETAAIDKPCSRCGGRAERMHSPIFRRGVYCSARCCPVCSPTPEPLPREPTLGPRPPEPPRPLPKRMAPGSSFLDLGFGPDRRNDPWYRDGPEDRAARSLRPPDRWLPRMPPGWLRPRFRR